MKIKERISLKIDKKILRIPLKIHKMIHELILPKRRGRGDKMMTDLL
jgi:hypothetical protein